MGTIFVFMVIILLILVGTSKKKTANIPSKPTLNSSIRLPDSTGLKIAHKYFGDEWHSILLKNTILKLPLSFYDTVAFAIQNLSVEEKKNLLLSFIKVSSDTKIENKNGITFSVGLNNYSNLHYKTLTLLQSNIFNESSFTSLLRQMAMERKELREKRAIEEEQNKILQDKSIIDVTGHSLPLKNENNSLVKFESGIPYWAHQYVYAYSEINNASPEQIKFYNIFKNNFLSGIYLDLEDNTNYSFILLFDFLNEYDINKDISKLEILLKILGNYYPRTKPYATDFLIKKMNEVGNVNGVERLKTERNNFYTHTGTEYIDIYRLGNRYAKTLNLNDEEIFWLNRFWNPLNNFLDIEGCCIESIKLYLSTIKELNNQFENKETSITKESRFLFESVKKFYHSNNSSYWVGNDDIYLKDKINNEVYLTIFKRAEQAIRKLYGHKRKVSGDFPYPSESLIQEFQDKFGVYVDQIIESHLFIVQLPDEKTEEELNIQNTNRWKIKFEQLERNFSEENKQEFISGIYLLEKTNKKNPSIENIFFEASKFISSYDKEESLKFYIYYLYYDLKSTRVDNKQLTKTIQKNLFKTNEQLNDFNKIVANLVQTKKLKPALKEVEKICQFKRKKIKLDATAIKEVQQQDKGTVELLNEYLNDEFEDTHTRVKTQEINSDEIKLEIKNKTGKTSSSFIDGISLNKIQLEAITLFASKSFSIETNDIDTFCKVNGVFKNQLVESINESCYDVLDDVLIEEEGNSYTLNKNYYQKIKNND